MFIRIVILGLAMVLTSATASAVSADDLRVIQEKLHPDNIKIPGSAEQLNDIDDIRQDLPKAAKSKISSYQLDKYFFADVNANGKPYTALVFVTESMGGYMLEAALVLDQSGKMVKFGTYLLSSGHHSWAWQNLKAGGSGSKCALTLSGR